MSSKKSFGGIQSRLQSTKRAKEVPKQRTTDQQEERGERLQPKCPRLEGYRYRSIDIEFNIGGCFLLYNLATQAICLASEAPVLAVVACSGSGR